jgi:hypothetical protein
LEKTIMLNGKKSALKTHLSLKKSTFTHKVMTKAPHDQASGTDRQMDMSADRDPRTRAPRLESNEVTT